jgi:hypothetical protein
LNLDTGNGGWLASYITTVCVVVTGLLWAARRACLAGFGLA